MLFEVGNGFSRVLLGLALTGAVSLSAQTIKLHVDLTDAPRNIYHAHLQIPVQVGRHLAGFSEVDSRESPSQRTAGRLDWTSNASRGTLDSLEA